MASSYGASPFIPPTPIDPSQYLYDRDDTKDSPNADIAEGVPPSPQVANIRTGYTSTSSLNSPVAPATPIPAALRVSKKPASVRTLGPGHASNEVLTLKKSPSSSSMANARASGTEASTALKAATAVKSPLANSASTSSGKIQTTPRLPHDKDALPAPATLMYWSRAPVYGLLPAKGLRSHSATLVDTSAWIFGGCDDKECWRDVHCFDVGAFSG